MTKCGTWLLLKKNIEEEFDHVIKVNGIYDEKFELSSCGLHIKVP